PIHAVTGNGCRFLRGACPCRRTGIHFAGTCATARPDQCDPLTSPSSPGLTGGPSNLAGCDLGGTTPHLDRSRILGRSGTRVYPSSVTMKYRKSETSDLRSSRATTGGDSGRSESALTFPVRLGARGKTRVADRAARRHLIEAYAPGRRQGASRTAH